jgi:iron complex outermembrane receptor protein
MPHHRVSPLIAVSLLFGTLTPASADSDAGRDHDLARVPANVTVITSEDIRRSGASTVQDALSKAEGVTVSDQQGFGLGSDSTLNLRGVANSARTNALVLVDGIRQNRITGDDVHWQAIPIDDIERIEILRGGAGVMYGEGALAGVINIVLKRRAHGRLDTEHTAEIGSYGWQKYHAGVRGWSEPFGYGVGLTRRLVDGYRESSASRNSTVTMHADWALAPETAAAVRVIHSEDVTGFPGLLTQRQTEQDRRQPNAFHGVNSTELDQASVELTAAPWPGVSSALTLFWRRQLQHSSDSIAFNAFTVTPSRGALFRTRSRWTAGVVENLLVSGIELTQDKAVTGDRDAFSGPDSESNRAGYGVALVDTVTAWDRVSLSGGLRFDKSRYEEAISFPDFTGSLRFEGWSPTVGVMVTAVPGQLELFSSYGRPFKAPNVDDFSSRIGSMFRSNADLKPQQADSYELGARFRIRAVRMHATAFYTRIDREILFNPFTSTNENFDTRRFGTELGMRGEWPDRRLRGYATYTFLDGEFRKGAFTGNTIPGAPEHTLHAGAGVSPLDGLWIDLDWTLVADAVRFNDVRNQLAGADNYGVLDLTCRYAVPRLRGLDWAEMSAYVTIRNLTNEEYVTYQSSDGSAISAGEAPMPPATVVAGVALNF